MTATPPEHPAPATPPTDPTADNPTADNPAAPAGAATPAPPEDTDEDEGLEGADVALMHALIYASDATQTVIGELDLTDAQWHVAAPDPQPGVEYLQYARIEHTNGETYVALRMPGQEPVLVFTIPEWDAFFKGVEAGEFSIPWNTP